MKVLGLVLAMVLLAGGVAVADTASFDIYDGWNLIAAPLVPFDPAPESVFAAAPNGVDGFLTRWDPASGGITYDAFDPDSFGKILLGDGYWLRQYATDTISYDGVADGVPTGGVATDMWISLPGVGAGNGGWHLIGNPYNHDIAVDDGSGMGAYVMFTDGTSVKNWADAVAAGWVDGQVSGWNTSSGGFVVSFDGFGDDDSLRAAKGYWIRTYVDNIAMILKP